MIVKLCSQCGYSLQLLTPRDNQSKGTKLLVLLPE